MENINKEEMYKGKTSWYKHITIEPTMFFYMMAFMITNVIEQTYYVFQACTVNHNYSAEICYNISDYEEINKEVQLTVSTFHQWNGIASHVVPLLLAFFLGAYSDKRGRKFIILAGLVGKLYFSLMITINTLNAWPLEYVIYTAAFPSALTAADLAIFAGCFAYIADVSSLKNRTLRVGILDVVYLSAMPTGLAIGNVLYNKVVNRSFTAMFAINTSLMVVANVYSFVFLKWQTRPEQKSLKEAGVTNPITDFFDVNNLISTLKTLSTKRPNNRRLFLWLLLISMAFYTFQRDERPVVYLYTSTVFKWDPSTFSHFRTYLSILYVFAMLLGIPIMTKMLHWRDTVSIERGAEKSKSSVIYLSAPLPLCIAMPVVFQCKLIQQLIVMLGATAHISGHLIYAQATTDKLMYVGATAASLGPCVAPLIRSMTSKVLPPSERGVAYAFLSVMENAVAMFASVIYAQLYKATLNTDFINAIFYLTITTQVIVFLSALTIEILLKGRKLEAIIDQDEKCTIPT